MRSKVAVGIDVGSHKTRVVVTEQNPQGAIRVVGVGSADSKGLKNGYVVNSDEVTQSIRAAVTQAEEVSSIKIRSAFLAIGGVGVDEVKGRGETIVSRADAEVTDLDIEKAISIARENVKAKLVNRKILHTIPLSFTIDGEEVLGRPQGMHGSKIVVEILFITCLEQHIHDIVDAVEAADVGVADSMANPLAGAIVTASNAEKRAGCVLANIGAETVSTVVFENSIPISVKVFRIGSIDITKDLALGLRISLDEAEQVKRGAITSTSFPKKKYDDIMSARLTDIFELIDGHLKKLGKDQLLPAGIILFGGGSTVNAIKDAAAHTLKLPSKIAALGSGQNTKLKDSSWAVAYGLTIWGLTGESADHSAMKKAAGRMSRGAVNFFKQFLP